MRYEFENGDYAIITAETSWARLTIYDKDDEVIERQISEDVLTLLDYLRDKVQEIKKGDEIRIEGYKMLNLRIQIK